MLYHHLVFFSASCFEKATIPRSSFCVFKQGNNPVPRLKSEPSWCFAKSFSRISACLRVGTVNSSVTVYTRIFLLQRFKTSRHALFHGFIGPSGLSVPLFSPKSDAAHLPRRIGMSGAGRKLHFAIVSPKFKQYNPNSRTFTMSSKHTASI